MLKSQAEQIVHDIIKDIMDRAGIGDEFQSIDTDIREEIFNEWVDIVMSGSQI